MEIKWYGTATLTFTTGGETIIFDPFKPMKISEECTELQELASIGDIFVTHGHFDHLMDVPALLHQGCNKVYCNETAASTLQREGVNTDRIRCIKPGDTIKLASFEIKILKGEHIAFDWRLIAQTLFNRRMFKYIRNIGIIIRCFILYPKGEMLVYLIKARNKSILHLGSLNLSQEETYPKYVDLMTIPFQGRSHLEEYALTIIKRIKPKALLLHHFDDSFPPISAQIPVDKFIKRVANIYPDMKVFVPKRLELIKF